MSSFNLDRQFIKKDQVIDLEEGDVAFTHPSNLLLIDDSRSIVPLDSRITENITLQNTMQIIKMQGKLYVDITLPGIIGHKWKKIPENYLEHMEFGRSDEEGHVHSQETPMFIEVANIETDSYEMKYFIKNKEAPPIDILISSITESNSCIDITEENLESLYTYLKNIPKPKRSYKLNNNNNNNNNNNTKIIEIPKKKEMNPVENSNEEGFLGQPIDPDETTSPENLKLDKVLFDELLKLISSKSEDKKVQITIDGVDEITKKDIGRLCKEYEDLDLGDPFTKEYNGLDFKSQVLPPCNLNNNNTPEIAVLDDHLEKFGSSFHEMRTFYELVKINSSIFNIDNYSGRSENISEKIEKQFFDLVSYKLDNIHNINLSNVPHNGKCPIIINTYVLLYKSIINYVNNSDDPSITDILSYHDLMLEMILNFKTTLLFPIKQNYNLAIVLSNFLYIYLLFNIGYSLIFNKYIVTHPDYKYGPDNGFKSSDVFKLEYDELINCIFNINKSSDDAEDNKE